MQLVADIGNTETVVGVVEGRTDVRAHWRLSSRAPRTADETLHLLRGLLRDAGFEAAALDRCVMGSVSPSVADVLGTALERLANGSLVRVGPGSLLPVRLDVDEPMTVGADRVVNTLAARELFDEDVIAVDLGTATTYDCITSDGVFVGGVIAPGVSAGLEWLGGRTALLPGVQFGRPETVVGRRTETCIRSGIFYAVVDGVDGMVRRIREEWKRPEALVIATGGWAGVVAPHCATVERIEPFLTLYGLAIAGELLSGEG